MEKGRLHIYLLEIQIILCHQGEYRSNGCQLYHQRKYLIVIYAFFLLELFYNQPCLVAFATVMLFLNMVYSFAVQGLLPFR